MSFTKIENADLNNIGVIGLPDVPGLSTAAMQSKLEETSRSVVIPKHNALIDELEDTTAASSVGATPVLGRSSASNVQAVMDKISLDLEALEGSALTSAFKNIESGGTTFIASGEDTFKINAGSNVTITPLVGDKGISISSTGGGGQSTGDMLMSEYDKDGDVKSASSSGNGIRDYVASAISGKADTSSLSTVATSGDYTDLSNKPTIPTKVSELTNDEGYAKSSDLSTVATSGSYSDLSNKPELKDLTDDIDHRTVSDTEKSTWGGKSVVSYSQTYTQAGQQIGTITIDGTTTNIIAPTSGGGGGGGAVDSVNNKTGVVVLELGDMDDVTFTSVAQNDAVVRNGSGEWVNVPLPMSALTGSYGDLSGKPNLATVATTGAYSDLSGTPALATVATSGSYNDLSNTPTIPTKVSDLTNDSGYQTASDVSTAISGKADTSSLGDLAYIDIDSASSTKVLQGDGTWVVPSTGGHQMIPIEEQGVTDIERMQLLANGNDNYVINAYSAKRWSNAETISILTTVAQGVDTVGLWEDEPTWRNYTAGTDDPTVYRRGWLFDECLYDILGDHEVEIEPVFGIDKEETVSMYAYRIDDDVRMSDGQGGTIYGGAIAFKLNGAIQNANGVTVGVRIKRQRTERHVVQPIQ